MKKILRILVLICILTIVSSSAVFAYGGQFSYSMNNRQVDGSKNGKYYSLPEGQCSLDGSHECEYLTEYVEFPVYYELRRKTSSITSKSFGTKSENVNDRGATDFYFTWNTDAEDTDYYFIVSKSEIDILVTGSGTVSD